MPIFNQMKHLKQVPLFFLLLFIGFIACIIGMGFFLKGDWVRGIPQSFNDVIILKNSEKMTSKQLQNILIELPQETLQQIYSDALLQFTSLSDDEAELFDLGIIQIIERSLIDCDPDSYIESYLQLDEIPKLPILQNIKNAVFLNQKRPIKINSFINRWRRSNFNHQTKSPISKSVRHLLAARFIERPVGINRLFDSMGRTGELKLMIDTLRGLDSSDIVFPHLLKEIGKSLAMSSEKTQRLVMELWAYHDHKACFEWGLNQRRDQRLFVFSALLKNDSEGKYYNTTESLKNLIEELNLESSTSIGALIYANQISTRQIKLAKNLIVPEEYYAKSCELYILKKVDQYISVWQLFHESEFTDFFDETTKEMLASFTLIEDLPKRVEFARKVIAQPQFSSMRRTHDLIREKIILEPLEKTD